jgi:hypothetical protein
MLPAKSYLLLNFIVTGMTTCKIYKPWINDRFLIIIIWIATSKNI